MADADTKKLAAPATPDGWSRPASEINATVRLAEKGDAGALAAVREMFAARPGSSEILGGNLAREATRLLVQMYAPNSPVTREAVTRKLEEMRAELSGTNPTPPERLLVERIVATWLHLHHLEVLYAGKESMPLALGLYYQKCISAAQKRYLAAVKGLSEVRKLALPTLQVNFAKQQVNIASAAVA